MRRAAVPFAILPSAILPSAILAAASSLIGCGSSAPREADIYHDPALRPGVVVAADGAEETLLARLPEVASAEVIEVADRRFEVERPYHAASGRWCRAVRVPGGEPRLACEADDGWVFVPQVVPTVAEPMPASDAEGTP